MPSKYYITTAIDYVNSAPHIGTAYEKVSADVFARFGDYEAADTNEDGVVSLPEAKAFDEKVEAEGD